MGSPKKAKPATEPAMGIKLRAKIDAPGLLKILQKNARGQLKKNTYCPDGKVRRLTYFIGKSQMASITWLLDRVIAKAPTDVNINPGAGTGVTFVFDDPRQRPEGYQRRPAPKSDATD